MKRKVRLRKAKKWLETRPTPTVDEYRVQYGVDPLCAAIELNQLGLMGVDELDQYWAKALDKFGGRRPKDKKERRRKEEEAEAYFGYKEGDAAPEWGIAYIAGFTPGGAPFGITYEEKEELEWGKGMLEQDQHEIDQWVATQDEEVEEEFDRVAIDK